MYIRGTVFVQGTTKYQTGESVSIKGNYNGYGIPLETGDKFDYSNIDFITYGDVNLATRFKSENLPLIVIDKIQYFLKAKDLLGTPIKTGGNNINIGNIKFSTGVRISDNQIKEQLTPIDTNLDTQINSKQQDFDFYINRLGNPQDDRSNLTTLATPVSISNFFLYPTEQVATNITGGEFFYVGVDPLKALHIKGIGSSTSEVPINNYEYDLSSQNSGSNKIRGIIVTRGDVYISGNVDFQGAIMTEGNVYFLDDNQKIITNDYNDNILPNLDDNYVIRTIYNQGTIGTVPFKGWGFLQTGSATLEGLISANTGTTSDISNIKSYSDLIGTTAWKKVE